MRSLVTAVIAVIEAVAVALAGMLVVVLPVLLVWVVTFDLAATPADTFAAGLGVWFLAHFVPLQFSIGAEGAVALGLPQAALRFTVSLAPLGLTLVTALLGARSGWRFGRRGGTGAAGVLGGAVGFAATTGFVLPFAAKFVAWPFWPAVIVPALVYAVPAAAAFLVRAARDEHAWWAALVRRLQLGLERSGVRAAALPARAGTVLRLAAASVVGLVGLSALGVAGAIVAGYVQIVSLSQSLQLDAVGAVLVFLLQLALLPVMTVWAASWFTGAGFALGSGSSATPFETLLGPLPSLPLFGAVPQGWGTAGTLAPALVVVLGVVVGVVGARTAGMRRLSWSAALSLPVIAGALAGLAVAGLGALATGALGPDRLAETGPAPWLFGGLAAGELAIGMLLGVAAGRLDVARLKETVPELVASGRGRGRGTAAGIAGADPDGAGDPHLLSDLSGARPAAPLDDLPTEPLDRLRPFSAEAFDDGAVDDGAVDHRADGARIGDEYLADEQITEEYLTEELLPAERPVGEDSIGEGSIGEGPIGEGATGPSGDEPEPPGDDGPESESELDTASAEERETEELLRAYSWDGTPQEPEPEDRPRRRGWRLPGRKD